MKILMLGWELPPHNSGGLGVACYQMCKQLASDGVDIEFVIPYVPGQHREDFAFMRVHSALPLSADEFVNLHGAYDSFCYACKSQSCEHAYPADLRGRQQHYVQFVEQLVQDNDYDVIHAHDWLTFEAGLQAKYVSGRPLVAHVHATEYDRAGAQRGNSLVHDIEQHVLMMADGVIAVSQFTKNLIAREYGIPANKIDVVHNSADFSDVHVVEDSNAYAYLEHMKRHGYKVVVSLSRLTIQKGIYHLLKAAQQVIAQNPKTLFLIAGDGDMREELMMRSAELGIAHNVIFTGFIRGKRWRDAYAIGDLFVLPSVSEPFGLTALEAANYHNAILLSKQSGVGEVLHSVMQFDFWDTDKLANEIMAIADHGVLSKTLADGALGEVVTMSWQRAALRFREIYGRLSAAREVAA